MQLVCPECKNDVDLSLFPVLLVEQIIECQMCGVSLEVSSIIGDEASAEVVDEGK